MKARAIIRKQKMAMTITILKIILESRKIISSSQPDRRKENSWTEGKFARVAAAGTALIMDSLIVHGSPSVLCTCKSVTGTHECHWIPMILIQYIK
jgi:hypothetical protein